MTNTTQRRRARRAIAATALAPLLALAGAGAAQADSAPLTWTFDKCATSGSTWEGTATGPGGTVPLLTTMTWASPTGGDDPATAHGKILRVTLDWAVGEQYVAALHGVLNLETGSVVMNGTVVEGDYVGSQVHEEGQASGPAGCFAGIITVLPSA